jgi:hypothetical protein
VVQLIKDAAEDVWHFVVTIGEAVFHAVLDTVEAVVAAATWIYNQIKIVVEDVIKFLEFLFGWQDILVTDKVLKNVFLRLSEAPSTASRTRRPRSPASFSNCKARSTLGPIFPISLSRRRRR